MGVVRGNQRVLYKGTAGSTATTQVLHVSDIDVDKSGGATIETTDRGDGTTIPIETHEPATRACALSFICAYYDDDVILRDLIAAAEAQTPRAIKVCRKVGGYVEVDADMTLKYTSPAKLKDGMPVEFTAMLSKDSGRDPVIESAAP